VSDNYAEAWGLEDAIDRERFTNAPRGQTEPITFRIYTHNARILDEIIHSGIDPRLKTKSDCLQDATSMFIDDWLTNYQDGISGRTLRMYKYERDKLQREARQSFLTETDEAIKQCSNEGDVRGLQRIRSNVDSELSDVNDNTPESYVKNLTARLDDLRRWLAE
jgi:hypothetical protein